MAIWIFSNLKLWAFQCCYEHFARHFLVNICLHFCYLLRVELLGKGMHMFSFNSSCKRVFQYYTFFFPINSVRKSSSCFTPSPKLGMFNRFTHLGLRLSVCVCVFTHICAHVCVCFSSVQSPKHVWLFATPGTAPCQVSLSITNFQSLLKLTSTYFFFKINFTVI